jgi:hypothetical protein
MRLWHADDHEFIKTLSTTGQLSEWEEEQFVMSLTAADRVRLA